MHLSSVSLTQRPTLFHQNLSADYEMIKSMSQCVAGLIKTMVALKHPQIVCEIRKEASFNEVPAFIFYR